MQSAKRNTKNWLLEFDTLDTGINPLMGWETSQDTMSEVKLEFPSKKQAIDCLLYTSPSPRDKRQSRMPSSA